jgi:DNA polymerase I-like protein with 3'-5' exonuclease and polymerase domains
MVGEIVRDCMELGQSLNVPLVVDMQCGPNWMERESAELAAYQPTVEY